MCGVDFSLRGASAPLRVARDKRNGGTLAPCRLSKNPRLNSRGLYELQTEISRIFCKNSVCTAQESANMRASVEYCERRGSGEIASRPPLRESEGSAVLLPRRRQSSPIRSGADGPRAQRYMAGVIRRTQMFRYRTGVS